MNKVPRFVTGRKKMCQLLKQPAAAVAASVVMMSDLVLLAFIVLIDLGFEFQLSKRGFNLYLGDWSAAAVHG